MAAEVKQSMEVETVLVPGSGGVFEVTLDGRMIYSKAQTGRFPREGELTELLRD